MGSLTRIERKQMRPCRACGAQFSKEKVQCPSCKVMNHEESPADIAASSKTVLLSEVKERAAAQRISTGCWDENWGKSKGPDGKIHAGIVRTSVSLLGGAPGAGKSTLSLQIAAGIAETTKREVLYIAGEEDEEDIKERATRLGITPKLFALIRVCPMGAEIDLTSELALRNPAATFVDSLPTIMPDPADAVEFATKLKHWASAHKMPVIIVDHVTKEEEFAGQMALQHAVDGTFLFTVYDDGVRELKTVKNRNGPSGVVTTMDMIESGLVFREPDDEDEDD